MAVSRLSDFASTSTTANAERFGSWTLSGGDRITLEAVDLSGTGTAANIRASVGGVPMRVVASATQQTTRGVIAFELLAHELPPAGARVVRVYWPSATRIHVTGVEWSGTRQRPTPSGDVFFATSASAQNANLTATAPTNGAALHMMCWYAGTSSWTLGSGQTKIGSDNQQTTFLSVGGYETGLSSGSQASDCSVAAAAAAIGQICMVIAEDGQGVSALDPADGATGVSTTADLELTTTATAASGGSGSARVYETASPSASAVIDALEETGNSTNATSISVGISSLGSLTGKRLVIAIAHDGGASVLTDDGSPSPFNGAIRATGMLIVWRECDGSEPSSYGFTANPGEGLAAVAFEISGHDPTKPPVFAVAEGNSSAPNPPSVAFPWGTEPTLMQTVVRADGGATFSAFPTDYTHQQGSETTAHGTVGDRACIGYAARTGLTGGSDDPGTYTLSAGELWTAVSIAHAPADPSVLVETIAVGSWNFSGTTVTIPRSETLTGSAAHHVQLDANALQDYEGIYSRTAWNFTTDAGGAGEDDLTGNDLAAGSPSLTSPALGQIHALSATDLATSAPSLTAGTLGQIHVLTGTDVATSAPGLTAGTIGQTHALAGQDVAAEAPALTSGTLGQTHGLTGSNLTSGVPSLTSPTVGQVHGLAGGDLAAAAPTVQQVTLGQVHQLTGNGLASGAPTLSPGSLVGSVELEANDLAAGAPSLTAGTLGQSHVLAGADLTTGQPGLTVGTFGQVHALTGLNLSAGTPTLTAGTLDEPDAPDPPTPTGPWTDTQSPPVASGAWTDTQSPPVANGPWAREELAA
ncbi:MAG TPA: hypothetical protein VGK73_08775 [Polyangiaceae bacterium]